MGVGDGLYARFKTVRRDEYVQRHCDLQDKKHENTVLSGEREAAASVVRAAIFFFFFFFFFIYLFFLFDKRPGAPTAHHRLLICLV